MRRPRPGVLILTVAALVLPLLGAVLPAEATPPNDAECLPLGAGTTGVLLVGGQVPTPDQLAGQPGGMGAAAPPSVARTLPSRIVFKDARHSFSRDYAFAVRDGRIFVRRAVVGVGRPGTEWRTLELPTCLDGHVTAISADHNVLLALGRDRQIYSHDMPGGDLSAERWTWRWGPYFWTGSGMRMFPDVEQWATSEFTSAERFTDTSGREQTPIGVGTVYLLRGDGHRITYLDPWLPQDESREVCGPRRGTLPLAGLSGSGSTVFVVSDRGGLYTRLYDFDISGANTVFGDYSWERGRPASDQRWQLPGPRWMRHRPPPGTITDRITIGKTGDHARDRVLRVEGQDASGRTGYWEKPLTGDRWLFWRTGQPLRGDRLPAADPRPTTAAADRRYVGTIGGRHAVVRNFHAECSPARVRIDITRTAQLDLILHSADGLRQERRDRGLTDVPREYNGAIEVPARTWRNRHQLPRPVRSWIAQHLDGRFTTAPLAVTLTRLRFLDQCWELTLNGAPARPDKLALPPDSGAVVGRLTEMQKDGRTPSVCPST